MQLSKLAENLIFPECLRWRDGELWFVDMYDGRLFSLREEGGLVLHLNRPTYLGGINWNEAGDALVIDKLARQVLQIRQEEVSVVADLSQHCDSKLNDTLRLPNGDLLIGEYGFDVVRGERYRPARIFRVDKNGCVSVAASGLAFPNAMALSLSGGFVYVVETIGKSISRFELSDTFELTNKTSFYEFEKGHPDGMCVDKDGALWVALLGTKTVVQVHSSGQVGTCLNFASQPIDIAAGKAPNILFVGTSDAVATDLVKAELPRTGVILKVEI